MSLNILVTVGGNVTSMQVFRKIQTVWHVDGVCVILLEGLLQQVLDYLAIT
jgi:hypothetical protein